MSPPFKRILAIMRSGYTRSPFMIDVISASIKSAARKASGKITRFDRGMTDVPLVPKRYILEGRAQVRPHEARKPRDALAVHGILFVRHSARSGLPLRKIFLRFAHFGPGEVPDLDRQLFEGRRENGHRRHHFRVPVALEHLARYGGGFKAQNLHGTFLDGRRHAGMGAHHAGHFSRKKCLRERARALRDHASSSFHIYEKLQAEGHGLRVDPVGPAHNRRTAINKALR